MKMKVTVCQMHDDPEKFQKDWDRLSGHVRIYRSDLVLLPEMPFWPWLAWRPQFDAPLWQEAVGGHDDWIPRLTEMGQAVVLGTRPVTHESGRFNEGFVWDQGNGYRAAQAKCHLPCEEGYWEAEWYKGSDGVFNPVQTNKALLGFSICTDLWFFRHAREYGKQGVHITVCPRATPATTLDKWLAGGQAAAVVSGAYSLSSNKVSQRSHPSDMGGRGWIIDPDGEVLAVTSEHKPIISMEIDLAAAEKAKSTYPRYVRD